MSTRVEVEMAGVGGTGVAMASHILAEAAASKYKYVNMFTNYMGAQRGGFIGATIIYSDEEIASPILVQAQFVLIFHPSQFKAYEDVARPGGTIIVETYDFHDEPKRKDIEILPVPARAVAGKINNRAGSNLVLLGAFIGAKKVLPPELIEADIRRRYAGREKVLSLNMEAFREGLKIGTELVTKHN